MHLRIPAFAFLLTLLLIPVACTSPPTARTTVVTSIPAAALIIRPLLPDTVPVIVILPDGASPHGFEPRPSDARTLESAAAIVGVHPHVDGWLSRLTSRPVSFMEDEDEADDGHSHDDAHAWMDPVRVKDGIPVIVNALCVSLPDACPEIRQRGDAWMMALDTLDADIRDSISQRPIRPVLTAEPFIHPLLQRYDVAYVGPVQDLPGQMASARRLAGLMEDVSEAGIRTLVTQTILRDRGTAQFAKDLGLDVLRLEAVGSGYDSYELYLNDVVNRLHAAR